MYDKFKISITRTYLDEQLPMYKEMHPWLKNVNSQSLQQANKNLDTAFTNFFEGRADYPTRKTKRFNNSFQVTQRYKINLTKSEVYFPNVGWIKVKMHRELFSEEFIGVKAGLLFPFLAGLLFPVWPVYFSSFDSLSFPKCERF